MSAASKLLQHTYPLTSAAAVLAIRAGGGAGSAAARARGRVPGQKTLSEGIEPLRVLVVEPNATARGVLVRKLADAGFEVLSADCLADARRLLSPAFDLPSAVVIEAALPDGDGIALCRELRADLRSAPMPVVVLGKGGSRRGDAIDAGADDYLAKPVFAADVVALVKLRTARAPLDQGYALDTEAVRLPDLTRALLASKASGTIAFESTRASLTFRTGRLVDARFADASGEVALRRVLLFARGAFTVHFGPQLSAATLALDEIELALRVLSGVKRGEVVLRGGLRLELPLAVEPQSMPQGLAELPDKWIPVLRLCDGVKSALRVVLESGMDEGSALEAIAGLLGRGLLTFPASLQAAASAPIPLPRIEEGLEPELQRQLTAFRISPVVEVSRSRSPGELVQLFPRPNPTELERAIGDLADDPER